MKCKILKKYKQFVDGASWRYRRFNCTVGLYLSWLPTTNLPVIISGIKLVCGPRNMYKVWSCAQCSVWRRKFRGGDESTHLIFKSAFFVVPPCIPIYIPIITYTYVHSLHILYMYIKYRYPYMLPRNNEPLAMVQNRRSTLPLSLERWWTGEL